MKLLNEILDFTDVKNLWLRRIMMVMICLWTISWFWECFKLLFRSEPKLDMIPGITFDFLFYLFCFPVIVKIINWIIEHQIRLNQKLNDKTKV